MKRSVWVCLVALLCGVLLLAAVVSVAQHEEEDEGGEEEEEVDLYDDSEDEEDQDEDNEDDDEEEVFVEEDQEVEGSKHWPLLSGPVQHVHVPVVGVHHVAHWAHPIVHPVVHPFVHPVVHPFVHHVAHPFVHPFAHPFVHPFVHPFAHPLVTPFTAVTSKKGKKGKKGKEEKKEKSDKEEEEMEGAEQFLGPVGAPFYPGAYHPGYPGYAVAYHPTPVVHTPVVYHAAPVGYQQDYTGKVNLDHNFRASPTYGYDPSETRKFARQQLKKCRKRCARKSGKKGSSCAHKCRFKVANLAWQHYYENMGPHSDFVHNLKHRVHSSPSSHRLQHRETVNAHTRSGQ